MERAENRSCVSKFRSRDNSTSKAVLDALKTIKLAFRKARVERVAIVKFGVNKRSCYSTGSFMIK